MDNIFFTLIVIISVVWSIFSRLKARRKKQTGATPLDGSLGNKLRALLNAIQKHIEQHSIDRTTDMDAEALDDWMVEEEEPQPRPKKMRPAVPIRPQTSRSDRVELAPGPLRQKALQAGKPSRTFITASRADLRKAVIWSEILGPPVALRDQRNSRR